MREQSEKLKTWLQERKEQIAAARWKSPDWKDVQPSAELTELLGGQDAKRAAIPDGKE